MRWIILLLLFILGGTIAYAFSTYEHLPTLLKGSGRIPEQVTKQLAVSGVKNPVTAVLLNFRGYDTLLEIGVLLLAMFGAFGLYFSGEQKEKRASATMEQPLVSLNQISPLQITQTALLLPFSFIVGFYLTWAGSAFPGGAFQGGAVIAGAFIAYSLLHPLHNFLVTLPGKLLLSGGFLFFILTALFLLHLNRTLLQYTPSSAGIIMLGIELFLTLSIAGILSGLFFFLGKA